MTVTVYSVGQVETFDQPGATFASADGGTLEITDGDGNLVAVFNNWDSVTTDAFDVAATTTPPVPGAPEATTTNPAPPEPTPHAPEEVPDTDVASEASEPADASTVTPETPLTPASGDVVIPAAPGGTTIGSPAS